MTIARQVTVLLVVAMGLPSAASAIMRPDVVLTRTDVPASSDTYVADGAVGANFSMENRLVVGHSPSGEGDGVHRALIRFDRLEGAIPADARVHQALLLLYGVGTSDVATLEASAPLEAWASGTVTWSSQPVAGDALDERAVGATEAWYGFDVTSVVAAWIDGTTPNHGLMVRAADEEMEIVRRFLSIEAEPPQPSAEHRPFLSVQWQAAVPTVPPRTPTATGTPRPVTTATPEGVSYSLHMPLVQLSR